MNGRISASQSVRLWRTILRAVFLLTAIVTSRADDYNPFYGLGSGSQVSGSFSISPTSNSAGLSNWNRVTVTFTWRITARNSEGLRAGTITLPGDDEQSQSCPIVGSGSSWTGSLTITDSSAYQGKTYTATLSGLRGWDSGQPDWAASPTSRTSQGVPGSGNTQGTATFSFSGGPWVYDGNAHTITITPNPAQAGWTINAGSDTRTDVGEYSLSVTPSNPDFTGSGSYNWSIVKAPCVAPTTHNTTATIGVPWSPPFDSGGVGGGGNCWAVADQTSWTATTWTPTVAGTYSFYVGVIADSNHIGATTAPELPGRTFSYSGATVTVAPATTPTTQISVSWNIGATDHQVQFPYDGNPHGPASPVFTPAYGGSYTLSGGQNANGSATSAGAYRNTVSNPDAGYVFVGQTSSPLWDILGAVVPPVVPGTPSATISASPSTIALGSTSTITASFTDSNPSSILRTAIAFNDAGFSYAGGASYNFNPSAVGSYSFVARIETASGWQTYGLPCTVTVTAAGLPPVIPPVPQVYLLNQTISIMPATTTVPLGGSVTFWVSGGQGAGIYLWSGVARQWTPYNTCTITFNTVGNNQAVSVYHDRDTTYNASNVVTAYVNVSGGGQSSATVTISGTSGQHSLRENRPQ